MFEVGGIYRNRRGTYTVLSTQGNKMDVRYENGETATLNMGIQFRIWENILAEEEAQSARDAARSQSPGSQVQYFVKTLSTSESGYDIPGLKQRIAVAYADLKMNAGDRLIYFAVDQRAFFAVATITGDAKPGVAKDFQFGPQDETPVLLYPIDTDTHVTSPSQAVALDSVELESIPNYRKTLLQTDQFMPIGEDDFELLAELVTEQVDEAEDDEDYDDEALLDIE